MSNGVRTFAQQLKHFSRSVDIVDSHTFDGVRELLIRYVKGELGNDAYFELLREQPMERQVGLRTFWSSEPFTDQMWPVRTPEGGYTRLAAVAFDHERPLWVVNEEKTALRESDRHQDQWSNIKDLPAYVPVVDLAMKTCIIVPLRRRSVLGVFCIEAPSYVSATDVARRELQLLSDALAILLELWQMNQSQSRLTQEAISELNEVVSASNFPRLTKPQVFVAYSHEADPDVVNVIRETLSDYGDSDKVEVTYWDQIRDTGNITVQIGQRITKSRFGVCYFSEPSKAPGSEHRYSDNANVIFEAGMLHAMTNAPGGPPSGWIPIRERDSPPAPFDFSNERIEYVPRTNSGDISDTFKYQLERRMKALLGEA
jgi:hypothetical protein